MKAVKWIWTHFKSACIYFTVFQLALTAFFQASAEAGGRGQFLIFPIELALLGFSVAMAAAEDIFRIKRFSLPVKLLIHFLSYLAASFFLFLIVTGELSNVRSLLFIMFGEAVLYAVCAAVCLTVRAVRNRKKTDGEKYEKQFENKK